MRIVIHACSLFLRFQTCKINVLKWHKGKCLVEAGHFCFSCCFSRVEERRKKVVQSCPTLCDPMDCSLLGSSIHGIFQARILEWVAVSFSRGTSRPRDWTQVSITVARRFTIWATREVQGLNFLSWWHSREKTQITLGDKMQARITKEQELWARCGHRNLSPC